MVEVVGRLASSSDQDQGEHEQVLELNYAPLSEENAQAAAEGEGWSISEEYNFHVVDSDDGEVLEGSYADSWADLCQEQGIDVEPVEIMNHWSVSNFLCEKLAEQGETVDEDFCGLHVWASTDYSLQGSPVICSVSPNTCTMFNKGSQHDYFNHVVESVGNSPYCSVIVRCRICNSYLVGR